MENVPKDSDDKSEDKKPAKKKKRAETLGAFAVDQKPETKSEDKPSLLGGLLNKEPKEKVPESADSQESSQLEELSLEEEAYIIQELVEASRQTDDAELDEFETLAVEEFRDKVLEGEATDQALEETLELLPAMLNEDEPDQTVETDDPLPIEFGDDEISLREAATDEKPANASGGGAIPPKRPTARDFPAPGRPLGAALTVGAGAAMAKSAERSVVYIDNGAGDFFIGAIIGYLIGRRRGRIKTEKRLKPLQKKLTKQVKAMKQDLQDKEAVVVKQARLLRNDRRQLDRLENRHTMVAEKSTMSSHNSESISSVPEVSKDTIETETKKTSPEKIGHIAVDVESNESTESKPSPAKPEKAPVEINSKEVDKSILTMSRQELLAVSSKIRVDGTTLRQIYETRLVGERGLRRMVAEHLKGGDVKRQLRKEIIEREIDFERDPVLRDRAHMEEELGNPTLKDLLEKAGANQSGESEEVSFYKARAAYESDEQVRQQQQRRLLDMGMVSVIVVLAIIITLLLFKQ
jgi:hypothetical protein